MDQCFPQLAGCVAVISVSSNVLGEHNERQEAFAELVVQDRLQRNDQDAALSFACLHATVPM